MALASISSRQLLGTLLIFFVAACVISFAFGAVTKIEEVEEVSCGVPNAYDTNGFCSQQRQRQEQQEQEQQQQRTQTKNRELKWETGTLRPKDLPGPTVFQDFSRNYTVLLPALFSPTDDQQQQMWSATIPQQQHRYYQVAEGVVTQINHVQEKDSVASEVSIIKEAVPEETIQSMLLLLRNYSMYDQDPDTVDGMPTYEMFVDSPELNKEGKSKDDQTTKILDSEQALKMDPIAYWHRLSLRKKLRQITKPVLDSIITPFVRQRYSDICQRGQGRDCTPCYSLIRRYKYGVERQSHATHYDGHAIVTVVVSLSDYGTDYQGGLYVSTGHGQREYLGLSKGDAAVHRSTLLHGVQVYPNDNPSTPTERWSWILWYRDSTVCDDHSGEWFQQCSHEGNAICQQLHATKLGLVGLPSQEAEMAEMVRLNLAAAEGGAGGAAVKVARAYLHALPSNLPYDREKARYYFQLAIESNNPEGHYGMAQLLITDVSEAEERKLTLGKRQRQSKLSKALRHLEEAAVLGHAFAMFNIGMAHVYGYGTPNEKVDMDLGAAWFVECGLPEGFFIAANHANTVGNIVLRDQYYKRAIALGHEQVWRKQARLHTGSGGAAGIDLNLPWPSSVRGIQPVEF